MSQTIEQVWADLQLIAKQNIGFKMNHEKVELIIHDDEIYHNAQEVISFLEAQGNMNGWVQETSYIHHLHNEGYKHRSIPLNAEWYDGTHSYLLEYIGQNQWLVKKYSVQYSDAPTHLAEKMVQCEVDSKQKLVYQRLWQLDGDEIVANIAVFVGFEGK